MGIEIGEDKMAEKVLFDFTYYQVQHVFHGGGEYGNTVLEELLSREHSRGSGVFFYANRYVDKDMLTQAEVHGWNIHPIRDLRNIAAIVRKYNYTTVYSALGYSEKWNEVHLPSTVRVIKTFHGLRKIETALLKESESNFFAGIPVAADYIYKVDGEEREREREIYSKSLLSHSNSRIIVVSEHTKYSMYSYFPQLNLSDITVLYSPPKRVLPINDADFELLFIQKIGVEKKKFGLIISAGVVLKNSLRGIIAYDEIFEKGYSLIPDDFKVVAVGIKNPDMIRNRLKNPDKFILLGYIEEKELEVLYKHAHLLLYPTLNEGFGYPPLEAMKYGTLCACSVNTSVSEICGDMAILFNPFLIDEIIVRILQSFSDDIRNEKINRMKEKLPLIQKRQQEDLKKLADIIMGVE